MAPLVVLAAQLPEDERTPMLRGALAAARAIGDMSGQAYALAALAPHLPKDDRQPVLREALAIARSIEPHYDMATALAVVAVQLPEAERQPVLHEALAVARAIWNVAGQAYALATLVQHLPEDERQPVLREALFLALENEDSSVVNGIRQSLSQAEVLGYLVTQLMQLSPTVLYALWGEILRYFGLRRRCDLLVLQRRLVLS